MNSLKRTLSLVLVLVMVLGLFGVAGAAYKDEAQIQYKEAVDVMTGIGAIEGDAGAFNPKGDLTRAAAAKMVAYTVLGADIAKTLPSKASSFKDVNANFAWAIPSIEYLVSKKVIEGYGDGNFGPNDKVTGNQLAKMLLCAIGYGKKGEFSDASWELNTTVLASSKGIFKNTKATDFSKAATREEAALYCFNALDVAAVNYSKDTDAYVASGSTIRSTIYAKLVKDTTPVNGMTGYTWMYKGTAISSFISDATALGSYTDGRAISAATTATNSKYIASLADDADLVAAGTQPVTYFYNGAAVPTIANGGTTTAKQLYVKGNKLFVATSVTAADGDAEYAVKGAIVTLYGGADANAKKVVSVAVTEKKVVELSAAPATKTEGVVNFVSIAGITSSYVLASTVSYPAGLVKGDVVLYYTAANGVTYVEKAEKISGTIASYVTGAYVTIGGTNYASSGLTGQPGSYDTIAELQGLLGKAGFTYYLDNGKNIVYVVAPSSVAVLTNTVFASAVDGGSSFGTYTAKAVVVKPDGTQEVVTVSKVDNGAGYAAVTAVNAIPTTDAGKLGAGTFYTYAKNADGSYNLKKAANQTVLATDLNQGGDTVLGAGDTSYTVTAKNANFLNKVTATGATWAGASTVLQSNLAHAGTVFMYYDATAKTYTTMTGINNAKSYAAGGTIFVLNDATNSFASLVICTGANASSAVTAYDHVFVTSAATVSVDANGTPTFAYKAVVNGEIDKVVTSYSALNAGTLYFIKDYAANGVALAGAALTGIAGAAHTAVSDVAYAGGTLIVSGTPNAAYILNANVKIFVIDTTASANTLTQVTPEQAAAMTYTSEALIAVPTSTTDASISAIYITVS